MQIRFFSIACLLTALMIPGSGLASSETKLPIHDGVGGEFAAESSLGRRVSLSEFNVNLTNVNTITIGLGNRSNPAAGGAGSVFFDDIRLYPPAP